MSNPKNPVRTTRNKRVAAYLSVMLVIYVLTYLMTRKELVPVYSDVRAHMNFSLSLDTVLAHSHFGWELLCWLCYACLPVSPETAACIVNSLLNAASGALVLWMCEQMLAGYLPHEKKIWLPAAVSVAALLAGPLFLRFYNRFYYLGQGTPNPWHNPTFTGVRPFMICITLLTIRYWQTDAADRCTLWGVSVSGRRLLQILLAVLLAYSTLIKPSFLTIYLPACVLLVLIRLIRMRGKGFFRLLLEHLYFIPAGLVLVWQYARTYVSPNAAAAGSGVAVSLFRAAGRYAPSVAVSWVMRMAFPLAVIIIWRRQIRKVPLFSLILAEYVFGQAIAFVFTETGSRASHGNFGWGNMLGTSMIWIFCLIFYVQQYYKEKTGMKQTGAGMRVRYILPGLLLLWHLSAGIVYYISLLHNLETQL